MSNKERAVQIPITLTDKDKELLRKRVGVSSKRHGEYFVRGVRKNPGAEHEIWYLVPYLLGQPKTPSTKEVKEAYLLSRQEAHSAWLFINSNPRISCSLNFRHTDDEEILNRAGNLPLENPRKDLSLSN